MSVRDVRPFAYLEMAVLFNVMALRHHRRFAAQIDQLRRFPGLFADNEARIGESQSAGLDVQVKPRPAIVVDLLAAFPTGTISATMHEKQCIAPILQRRLDNGKCGYRN